MKVNPQSEHSVHDPFKHQMFILLDPGPPKEVDSLQYVALHLADSICGDLLGPTKEEPLMRLVSHGNDPLDHLAS